MVDVNDFVGKDVNDLGQPMDSFRRRKVPTLKMSVTVKVVTRFGNVDKPVDGFQSLVSVGILIMDTKRR
jgi:hypothetical protein